MVVLILLHTDENGIIELIERDTNNDGTPDSIRQDLDGDGDLDSKIDTTLTAGSMLLVMMLTVTAS